MAAIGSPTTTALRNWPSTRTTLLGRPRHLHSYSFLRGTNMSKPPSSCGSAFEVPKNQKGMKASTPTVKIEKDSTLCCDLSAIKPVAGTSRHARRTIVPKASAPAHNAASRLCDVSAVKPHRGIEPKTVKSCTLKSEHEAAAKAKKLDIAYNNYLYSLAFLDQEKQLDDTKVQIEASLTALTKQLSVNLAKLETTKQRSDAVSFLTHKHHAVAAKKEALTKVLADVEGMAQTTSELSAAVGDRVDRLELRNIAAGTAEMKTIITDCNEVLNKLKATNQPGDENVSDAVDYLNTTREMMKEVNARYTSASKKLPSYQGAAVSEHMMQTHAAERAGENDALESGVESIGESGDD